MRIRLFILGILCILCVLPLQVQAASSLVLKNIEVKNAEMVTGKRNIMADLKYRLFEKDTRDFLDYLLLAILVVGLLIVMIYQNTRYYYIKPRTEFLESNQLEDNNLSLVDEIIEAKCEDVEQKKEQKPKSKINHKPGKKLKIKKDI